MCALPHQYKLRLNYLAFCLVTSRPPIAVDATFTFHTSCCSGLCNIVDTPLLFYSLLDFLHNGFWRYQYRFECLSFGGELNGGTPLRFRLRYVTAVSLDAFMAGKQGFRPSVGLPLSFCSHTSMYHICTQYESGQLRDLATFHSGASLSSGMHCCTPHYYHITTEYQVHPHHFSE